MDDCGLSMLIKHHEITSEFWKMKLVFWVKTHGKEENLAKKNKWLFW